MRNAAILLAGGSGSRMRGSVNDKVLEPLMGLPVILHSFGAFLESGEVGEVVFVCRDDVQAANIKDGIKKFFDSAADKIEIRYTRGGAERQDSVLNGLREISDKSGLVFIHDGARPLVGVENVKKLGRAAEADGAAVLAAKVTDTIKRIPDGADARKCKLEDMDRSRLWAMQTPQVFKTSEILSAYEGIKKSGARITDDVAAAVSKGIGVTVVENMYPNPKITVPEDIAFIEFLNEKSPSKEAVAKCVLKAQKSASKGKK